MQLKIILIFLSGIFLSNCSSLNSLFSHCDGKNKKTVSTFIGDIKVNQFQFENGLHLLVIEDSSSPTFSYQTWYRVGSRDEVEGRTGLAHFFEHMMFKETTNMKEGEFDKLLEKNGAEGENAFTSRDYTVYIQELPKEKLKLIIKAEADRMSHLVIKPAALKTEREVVQNERRFRNENNPDGLMEQKLFSLAFKRHPYRWPVIGYQEDLESMTERDARDFYESYYSPNHATVIVVGDVIADDVYALVKQEYGALKAHFPISHPILAEEPQNKPRLEEMKLNIQVEKLFLGYPIAQVTNADSAALDLLQSILTGGKSSRLNQILVEAGIATSAQAYNFDGKDPSLFVVMVNLQKGKKAKIAEQLILKEFSFLSKNFVSTEELERARNKLNFDFFDGLSSNSEKSYFLGHYESIAGDFMFGVRRHEKIQELSQEDLQRVVKKYFNPKFRSAVIGVKK